MKKIGFIGVGNMGGALADAVCKVINPQNVYVSDMPEKAEQFSGRVGCHAADNAQIAAACDCVFLGVKPQGLSAILEEIRPAVSANRQILLVSMAAGVPISKIEALVGKVPVIRIMPNLPVKAGAGLILYAVNGMVSAEQKAEFCDLLAAAGELDELAEALMDAASAISGCGPAFVSMFADALATGGTACGLPSGKALQYALQTLIGTAKLLKVDGRTPAELTRAVCSPKGSTIEGVEALRAADFEEIAASAVKASYIRTKELGKS